MEGKQNMNSDREPALGALLNENKKSSTADPLKENLKLNKVDGQNDFKDFGDRSTHSDQSHNMASPAEFSAHALSNNDHELKFEDSEENTKLSNSKCEPADNMETECFSCELEEDTICGIGNFRPQWMQQWATPRVFLVLFSILGVLQGSNFSYFGAILTTVEKRFAFNSKVSGFIMMAFELSPLFFGVLTGYYGGRAHRPRMVALGMLMAVSCTLISTLPYFLYGSAEHLSVVSAENTDENHQLCDYEGKDDCNEEEQSPKVTVIALFVVANFLRGFGGIAYHTIGISYMDDNTNKKSTPMYFGVTLTLRLFGPLLGSLIGSACLKFYENPFHDPGYGPEDPRWIGAWWIGYIITGVLLTIFTIPIALFPRRLPGQPKLKLKEKSAEKTKLCSQIPGLFIALKRILMNPLFIFIVVNTLMMIYGTVGHHAMLPKYMENQFRLTASDANLFSGPPGLVAVMASTMLGGFLIWKFKPTVKVLVACMVIIEAIGAAGYLLLIIPSCGSIKMSHFGRNDEGLILDSPCNLDCHCTTSSFAPVCGPDGDTTYFSACFAGCSKIHDSADAKEKQMFYNCSCLTDQYEEQSHSVTEGYCPVENCWLQAVAYIVIWPIFQGIRSVLIVANTMLLLRCVHPRDKSLAMGTFESLVCPLGFMPFTVIFGAIVDSACVVWEKTCGETGNCWVYDMDKFNYMMHGISSLFSILSAVSFLGIYYFRERVRNFYEDEEDEIDSIKATEAKKSGSMTQL